MTLNKILQALMKTYEISRNFQEYLVTSAFLIRL